MRDNQICWYLTRAVPTAMGFRNCDFVCTVLSVVGKPTAKYASKIPRSPPCNLWREIAVGPDRARDWSMLDRSWIVFWVCCGIVAYSWLSHHRKYIICTVLLVSKVYTIGIFVDYDTVCIVGRFVFVSRNLVLPTELLVPCRLQSRMTWHDWIEW